MFISRFFGRTLFTAAKSEASAAANASVRTMRNPLEEFFEADRSQEEDKPVVYAVVTIKHNLVLCLGPLGYWYTLSLLGSWHATTSILLVGDQGRSWKASELRLKSWDDLQKLWYVLLKEKNMLMTQRQMLHAQNLRFPNPERVPKVRKSMCRIKHVLTERAIDEPDPRRCSEMKRMINAL
ncbi:uncharacterized protein LOC143853318 isoform X1 [Tasmannia lanceolata]|uniref:uncharacterized protein LOC143853318 isoform X1 n=1 Tax=Tasmannia lanceolata TaxID=3420 RepID=UPI004062E477